MRLMRRRIMQAKACTHQRAKSCEATLCSVIENMIFITYNVKIIILKMINCNGESYEQRRSEKSSHL